LLRLPLPYLWRASAFFERAEKSRTPWPYIGVWSANRGDGMVALERIIKKKPLGATGTRGHG